MSTEKYAVYLILYFGNNLPLKSKNSSLPPRRYIGSSKIKNINNGYLGSVTSKKYSKVWKEEIRQNMTLFKLRILSVHDNGVSAREEEKRLQLKYDVVKSDIYVNLAIASPDGYFGKTDTGREFTEETKLKMSIVRKGKTYEEIFGNEKAKKLKKDRKNQKSWNKGKTKNDNEIIKEYGKKVSQAKSNGIWITNGIEDKYISGKTKMIPEGWKNGRTKGKFPSHKIQCLTCKKIIQGIANFNSHVIKCDFLLIESKRKFFVKEILSKTSKAQRKHMQLGGKWRTKTNSELEKILQKIN